MFYVSTLLLEDALLKCAVTESYILFSVVAFKTDISQGSVATHLRCDWILSDDSIITNFFLILAVKSNENWSVFDEVIRSTKK